MELRWISRSRTRLASSSGAARTSSSSCLIMLPMRMTLAGCSTISATFIGFSPESVAVAAGQPSGPTTITRPLRSPSWSGSVPRLMFIAPKMSLFSPVIP